MKLLAIDDLEDNLISLSAMLRAYLPDCEVKTVRSGMAGLELARTWQPDTILLDIQMPGMDGFQVCQALKNYTPTKHIPIIFLTAARTDPASHVRGLELGADAFLTKPFEPVELTAQVRAMVRIKVAEDALRTDKQGLEQMVAERTAALQAQTTQLDAIFDASPVAMLVLDEKTNVVRLNAAAAALGTSHSVSTHPPRPGEALGCVHATEDSRGCGYAPDCQLCQVRQGLEKVLAGGAVVRGAEMELELVRQGHPQRVWFRVGAETITVAGRPHLVVALEDVSARHRDAAALLESEEKYRLLVEHAHEAIFVVRSGIIKFANAKCGELVGVPAAVLVGRSALEWALPEERAELEASQLRMQRGEIYNTQAERRMVTRDGSIRWLAINAVPFTWQGEPATLNFATDTTEHKRAEAAVQREQRFANRLLDSLPGIFYLYTYPELRLVQWNKNHETVLGFGPEELLGFHIPDWH
jgi:PAS domain S-box-containing protein